MTAPKHSVPRNQGAARRLQARWTVSSMALALAVIMFGCSEDALGPPYSPSLPPGPPMRVLQAIPADEQIYPRQEFPFSSAQRHYRLRRGENVAGSVLTADGDAVNVRLRFAGARNAALDSNSLRKSEIDTDTEEPGAFRTYLVAGEYVVDILPFQSASSLLSDKSWPAQRQSFTLRRDEPLNLILRAGTIFEGTVFDAAGVPMTGVTVRSVSESERLTSNAVVVDSNGQYRIAIGPSSAETYRLEFAASPERLYPRVQFGGLQTAAEPQTMDIQYLPITAVTATGQVLDPHGAAAPDVAVVFSASLGTGVYGAIRLDGDIANTEGQATFRTRTDETGRYSLKLPLGAWSTTLTLQAPIDREYGGLSINPYIHKDELQTYTLAAKRQVAGRVIDVAGQPVTDANVVITRTLVIKEDQQVQRVQTDADGWFRADVDQAAAIFDVSIIPTDGIHARCSRGGLAPANFAEDFVVPAGMATEGFIGDEDGRPVARVSISVVASSGSSGPPQVLAESLAPTDDAGRFSVILPPKDAHSGCR